jgi:hypothetical protein
MGKTSEEMINEALTPLIAELKKAMFVPEYQNKATDEEVMGAIVSKYMKWDIGKIVNTAIAAFEDANFDEGVTLLENI